MEITYQQGKLNIDEMRALVVEDDPHILTIMSKVVRQHGYEVTTATNGTECMQLLEESVYPLVVLDWNLPGATGLELCKFVRSKPYSQYCTVFMVTARTEPQDQEQILNAGADDYLAKPFSVALLNLRLRIIDERVKDRISRRLADAELDRSENQYETLLQTLPDVVYRVDPEGRFVFVNESIRDFGYTPEELQGKHFSEIFFKEDIDHISRELVLPALEGKATGALSQPKLFDERRTGQRRTRLLEVRLRTKSGKAHMVRPEVVAEVSACGLYDDSLQEISHKFLGTIGILRDVTERKETERVRNQLDFVNALLAAMPTPVYYQDNNGRYLGCNDAFAEFVGTKKSAIKGKEPSAILHPDDVAEFRQRDTDLLHRSGNQAFDTVVRNSRGEKRQVIFSKARFTNEDSSLSGIIGVLLDITELKEAEDRLREYEKAVENLDEMVVVLDRGRVFRLANRAFLENINRKREEIMGAHIKDILDPQKYSEVIKEGVDRAFAGNVVSFEIPDGKPIGEGLILFCTCYPINAATAPVERIVWVIKDLTTQRQAEERAHQSQKMEAIGQLAGGIAHDLNNQLAPVQGYASLLKSALLDNEELYEYADIILRSAVRSADLNKQLLAFARKGKYESREINLHLLINEVEVLLAHSLNKNITLRKELMAEPPITSGDPAQLQSSLLNIAINARDAMPDGGTMSLITETVNLSEDETGQLPLELEPGIYNRITIRDTGTGMDEKTRQRVFEPFFTTKDEGQGTGMGMAAVYGIVKNHNGSIEIISQPGYGTSVTIYLPLARASQRSAETIDEDIEMPRNATLMVVDDEPLIRKMIRTILEPLGFNIILCEDGIEALDQYTTHQEMIDLVLLDIMMPRQDGYTALEGIRKLNPEAYALVVTGYQAETEALSLPEENIVGFLQKPFDHDQLLAALEKAFREISKRRGK